MSIEIISTTSLVASALATVIGGLLSSYAKRKGRDKANFELVSLANSTIPESERDLRSEVRLPEVDQLLEKEEGRKTLFRYSAASLIVGQFIVGGALTSSFVTRTLSEHTVGLLGLLVLASSLVSQHFRPDLLHKATAEKIHRLRSLKRWIEDSLYEATIVEVDNGKLIGIRRTASATLKEIEAAELQYLNDDKSKEA